MGLRRADVRVHVPEVCETPGALVIELRERCHETIALSRRQCVGVLSNPHHNRDRANQGGSVAGFYFHISIVNTGRPNLPATKNGTDAPVTGTGTVTLLENAPAVPLR